MEKQTKNQYKGLTEANQHATQARIENRDDWTKKKRIGEGPVWRLEEHQKNKWTSVLKFCKNQ
jgi:hypothetical protein